jgi:hypothetical protein
MTEVEYHKIKEKKMLILNKLHLTKKLSKNNKFCKKKIKKKYIS